MNAVADIVKKLRAENRRLRAAIRGLLDEAEEAKRGPTFTVSSSSIERAREALTTNETCLSG